MMVLVEVGDKVIGYKYSDDASFTWNELRDWLVIQPTGSNKSYYRMDRVVGVVPDDWPHG
jgi:hypothetical protein